MKLFGPFALACWLILGVISAAQAGVVAFEDFQPPPPTDGSMRLIDVNGSSSLYQGVTWDSRIYVVGDEYRVDTATPGPVYGIPHSGHYFITNGSDATGNNGITLTTNQVLLGAWFGQNEYYGFGTGATRITITAVLGATDGPSVVFDLPGPPSALPGNLQQPVSMGYVDTSLTFSGLTGITGYRIDRPNVEFRDTWVADDFKFTAAVPEPSSVSLLSLGLLALGGSAWRGTIHRNRDRW